MKWISFNALYCKVAPKAFLLGSLFFFFNHLCLADPPNSLRQQHPLAMLHHLPTGELPGWSAPWWMNFELSAGNVWNAPLTMLDVRNGNKYEYFADFEQSHAILEVGKSLSERLAVAVEAPYVHRDGGTMDHFIDTVHLLFDNRRFNRHKYPKNKNIFSVKTEDVEYYTGDDLGEGLANISLKIKWWLLPWLGQQKGSCPCGIAVSSQTKFPTQPAKWGGTSGDIDQSFLVHLGLPLFSASAFWMTAGYTKLGDNPAMKVWPRHKELQMYDFNLHLALSKHWGIILGLRAESPFLNAKHLAYYDTTTSDPNDIAENRASSGWNSLVRWRGTNSLGLSFRTARGSHIQFQVAEDWGIGPYDASDDIYSNGAPDVNFVLQSRFVW